MDLGFQYSLPPLSTISDQGLSVVIYVTLESSSTPSLHLLRNLSLLLVPSIVTYLLNYLLTRWSRVLLEKLIGSQVVEKFSAFYGTRRFITAVTSACHLSLS